MKQTKQTTTKNSQKPICTTQYIHMLKVTVYILYFSDATFPMWLFQPVKCKSVKVTWWTQSAVSRLGFTGQRNIIVRASTWWSTLSTDKPRQCILGNIICLSFYRSITLSLSLSALTTTLCRWSSSVKKTKKLKEQICTTTVEIRLFQWDFSNL